MPRYCIQPPRLARARAPRRSRRMHSAADSAARSAGCAPRPARPRKSRRSAAAPVAASPAASTRSFMDALRRLHGARSSAGVDGSCLIVEAIRPHRLARVEAVVPVQLVVERICVVRETSRFRIRIGAHRVEGQLRHGERRSIPPVHVLHKSVGVEEVVALPVRGQRGQLGRVELRRNLLAAAEDHIAVVDALQQRASRRPCACSCRADAGTGPVRLTRS